MPEWSKPFRWKQNMVSFSFALIFLTQSHLVTCCVDQADLEFRELPASASPVLGLRACLHQSLQLACMDRFIICTEEAPKTSSSLAKLVQMLMLLINEALISKSNTIVGPLRYTHLTERKESLFPKRAFYKWKALVESQFLQLQKGGKWQAPHPDQAKHPKSPDSPHLQNEIW